MAERLGFHFLYLAGSLWAICPANAAAGGAFRTQEGHDSIESTASCWSPRIRTLTSTTSRPPRQHDRAHLRAKIPPRRSITARRARALSGFLAARSSSQARNLAGARRAHGENQRAQAMMAGRGILRGATAEQKSRARRNPMRTFNPGAERNKNGLLNQNRPRI